MPTNVTVSFQVQPTWGQIFFDNVLLQRAATVNNPGFETSYEDPFWQTSGQSYLLQTSARSGSYAQQFHTNSSAWQTVAGLLPNTTYNLKLWVTGPSGPGLQVSVANSDGINASTTIHPNNAYQSGMLSFTTGDSDSTGAITGNILGAYLGVHEIPSRWLAHLELKECITEIADDLATIRDWPLSEMAHESVEDQVEQDYWLNRYPEW